MRFFFLRKTKNKIIMILLLLVSFIASFNFFILRNYVPTQYTPRVYMMNMPCYICRYETQSDDFSSFILFYILQSIHLSCHLIASKIFIIIIIIEPMES